MRRDALAAGLVAVCLWGLAPVATRAAVGHLSPLPLLLIRLAAAALVMLPWAWPVLRRLRPRSAGRLAALHDRVRSWAGGRAGPDGRPLLEQPDVRRALARTYADQGQPRVAEMRKSPARGDSKTCDT